VETELMRIGIDYRGKSNEGRKRGKKKESKEM
jgi:hypothetical protein